MTEFKYPRRDPARALPRDVVLLGLDIGQSPDPSALSVVQRSGRVPATYGVRWLKRWALGHRYSDVVLEAAHVATDKSLEGLDRYLVIDATGVGRPVLEMFDAEGPILKAVAGFAGVSQIAVTITAGFSVTVSKADRGVLLLADEAYNVPRRDLISTAQVVLQTKRLRIAEGLGRDGEQLLEEFLSLRRRMTDKGETFEPDSAAGHDDLVLSVALPVWYGEQVLGDVYREETDGGETQIPLRV